MQKKTKYTIAGGIIGLLTFIVGNIALMFYGAMVDGSWKCGSIGWGSSTNCDWISSIAQSFFIMLAFGGFIILFILIGLGMIIGHNIGKKKENQLSAPHQSSTI